MGQPIVAEASRAEIADHSFHQIVRRCSSSVAIVTAGHRDAVFGETCTSFTALSLSPPRLLINLDRRVETFRQIERSGTLGLNILNAAQEELASRFSDNARSAQERFAGYLWVAGPSHVPLLEHAAATLECEVEEIIERHAHALIICRVLQSRMPDEISALVYWNDQYREVSTDEDLVLLADMSGPKLSVGA